MAYPPGSGMPPTIQDLVTSCTAQGGQVDFTVNKQISGSTLAVTLIDAGNNVVWSSGGTAQVQPFIIANVADGHYTLQADNGEAGAEQSLQISCGLLPGSLTLAVGHTDETGLNANDGTITLTPAGGTDPVTLEVVELSLSRQTTSGTAETFTGIPPATYTVRAGDSANPKQATSSSVTVLPFLPAVAGCQDEYADNYDPAATSGGYASCTYTPRWRSAWQPMGVRVAAQAGQVEAFVRAELRIGFRPGHPLAADRPLGAPLVLRATVAPDGYATFVLGPYLRPQLGAPDGAGGYRLDINSPTAYSADLYVGYELRRTDGTLLEHGLAVNAAVPDAQLAISQPGSNSLALAAFGQSLPVWPGYGAYLVAITTFGNTAGQPGTFGAIASTYVDEFDTIALPCPLNPLPIAWLAPGSGYGFWVFQGKSTIGDNVGEGQPYREASSGEQRLSDPGEAYQTYKASSGVFKGDALLIGLRTLWRSPQAWVQLGGVWVPIVVERGSREVGRLGVLKNEVSLSFQLAMSEWAQGQ